MGSLVIQRILQCDVCGKIPEDGEKMWYMAKEVWCKECVKKNEEEEEEEEDEENI